MPRFDDCERLYLNDPLFRKVTDMLYGLIDNCEITPYEIRQAATYAATLHQQRNPCPLISMPYPTD